METTPSAPTTWQAIVARYARPDLRQSVWQLANTLVPYALCWLVMLLSLRVSYWLTLLLAIPTAPGSPTTTWKNAKTRTSSCTWSNR